MATVEVGFGLLLNLDQLIEGELNITGRGDVAL